MESRSDDRIELDQQCRQDLRYLTAYRSIQNLMGVRAFYHDGFRSDLELTLYANRGDVSWGQNHGFWIGLASIRKYYVKWGRFQAAAHLRMISELYPEIKKEPRNIGAGSFLMHTLTTPIIEIAGDFETAKAMWYSPSTVIGEFSEGKPFVASWMWEKYAADLIREDDGWKFWHLNVFTDWMTECSVSPATLLRMQSTDRFGMNEADVSASEVPSAAAPADDSFEIKPDVITPAYELWWQGLVPQLKPSIPVPYLTFKDTFSYGPDGIDFNAS